MPQSLSGPTRIDRSRIASDVAYVLLMKIDVIDPDTALVVDQIFVTKNSEPFDFNGQTYDPLHFDINFEEKAGEEGSATVSINDVEGQVSSKVNQYGGGIGSRVEMMLVNSSLIASISSEAHPENNYKEISFNWLVRTSKVDDLRVVWSLGLPSFMADRFPSRLQYRDRCGWSYRDPETCGYSGELESCDYTLLGENGCVAHDNDQFFGGFPGLVNA